MKEILKCSGGNQYSCPVVSVCSSLQRLHGNWQSAGERSLQLFTRVDEVGKRELLDDVESHSGKDVANFVEEVLDGVSLLSQDELEERRQEISSYMRAQEAICRGVLIISKLINEARCEGLAVETDESGTVSISCGNSVALTAFHKVFKANISD